MPEKQTDPEIRFEDIPRLMDREIQMLLREVDVKDLAIALIGASTGVKDRVFSNVSERVKKLLEEEMEVADSARRGDAEGMRVRIVEIVKQLREAGQIAWPPPAKGASARKPKLGKPYLSAKRALRSTVKRPLAQLSFDELNRVFVGFAEVARKEGLMALDQIEPDIADEFIQSAVRFAVDGTEPLLIQAILETWMESLLREQKVKYRKILEGIMSIQSGDNPQIVEFKLEKIF